MKIIVKLLIGTILFVIYVRYLESRSVFYPTKYIAFTPRDIGLAFEDVYFKTEDNVQLNGWFIPSPSNKSTLIFFHGNAGNIGDRLGKIQLFYKMGLNVLIIDYRGYGKSEGKPTEEGMYKDALAAYDYLLTRSEVDPENIIAYGASLGGAAAVDLATERKLACLIIDSSFSNAADIAKKIFPFVPSFLLKTKLDSITKIRSMTIPKLFIHSVDDEVIPFALGKKLYDAAPEPKRFSEIEGSHNEAREYAEDKYTNAIREFLEELKLI